MIDVLITVLTYIAMVLVVLVIILMIAAWQFRHMQDMLLYYPQEPQGSRQRCDGPRDFGISRYEVLEIRTPDNVTLRGFLVQPPTGASRCTLIYFHGNAGNVGHRTPIAKLLAERCGATVIMMDYRGYGLSDGGTLASSPSESGLKTDGMAVMDFCLAREDLRRLPLYVMGTSLGGAVTSYLASQSKYDSVVAGWIVENSFTSISDMADVVFAPFINRRFPGCRGKAIVFTLSYIIKPIVLQIGWYSIDAVRHVRSPMLFISSAKDELVPPAHVQALHDSATRSVLRRFVTLPDSTHNDAPAAPGYCDHISGFVHEANTRRGHHLGTV